MIVIAIVVIVIIIAAAAAYVALARVDDYDHLAANNHLVIGHSNDVNGGWPVHNIIKP